MRLAVRSGVIIPVLLMLPNVAWMLLPKSAAGTAATVPIALTIAENVVRVATLALPFFCSPHLTKRYSKLAMSGWFVPAVYDSAGVIYEVLRPDVTIEFTRDKGRPLTFEWRGDDDRVFAKGTRRP